MLIKIKNPELFERWMQYFEKHSPEMLPAEKRTYSFFNSQEGKFPSFLA